MQQNGLLELIDANARWWDEKMRDFFERFAQKFQSHRHASSVPRNQLVANQPELSRWVVKLASCLNSQLLAVRVYDSLASSPFYFSIPFSCCQSVWIWIRFLVSMFAHYTLSKNDCSCCYEDDVDEFNNISSCLYCTSHHTLDPRRWENVREFFVHEIENFVLFVRAIATSITSFILFMSNKFKNNIRISR